MNHLNILKVFASNVIIRNHLMTQTFNKRNAFRVSLSHSSLLIFSYVSN